MVQGYNAYKNTTIETADQGKLILIAYDVAIKHSRLALEKFEDFKLIEERTKHIFKVQDAITELMGALRLDVGEVATNLYRLYDYILRCLVEANLKANKGKITEVLGYLEMLRDAWSEAILKLKSQSASIVENNSVAVTG